MVTTGEFRNGFVMKMDGELWAIVEFQHVKPGKGGAFVRTKIKNVKTGRVIEKTFRSGEKVEDVRLEKKQFQFLYREGDSYHFMNNESYEQVSITGAPVENVSKFLKDGMDVDILFHGTEPLEVEVPIFVELLITKSDPGVRGDTATGVTKPALLETGAEVQIPLFIEEGERIKVDTRTGEYVERVK
ncbi:elongation factor P [candidate division KSB1 bacterium]|nr:elongation factor P [candidate division KSB1 bacterium]